MSALDLKFNVSNGNKFPSVVVAKLGVMLMIFFSAFTLAKLSSVKFNKHCKPSLDSA